MNTGERRSRLGGVFVFGVASPDGGRDSLRIRLGKVCSAAGDRGGRTGDRSSINMT